MIIRPRRIAWTAAGFALALSTAFAQSLPVPTPTGPLSLPGPDMVTPWFNGVITSIGSVWACGSNPPIYGTRVMGYTGFSHPPPNYSPAIGEVFYTHLVLGHPGNPCGGSVVGLELILPPGVETAVSANNPTFCFAILPNPDRLHDMDADPDYGCPTTFPQGLEGLAVRPLRGGFQNSSAWGMAQGFWLEILIPLRATQVQLGNQSIRWRVNPGIAEVGYAEVPAFVNGDVLFRDEMENTLLLLDLCTVNPAPQGC
ncbi:hypothetical protein [Dokdonella fugitiva]|uniref:Uncharacterized protein n=1 Tax=Dokdonella fugitiva TaxID=328517 RepID=A0A4R2IHU2_9GAMM|nr:hypothetical protein [Dokdonella fugitiva]MBA8882686.1 hypothetical protein [Dokdonella fugitiva]TCO43338.1 hypothetical protein EV148_101762 [Dokdonella fugitiva]